MSKYKIITPNINYNGMTHNVQFIDGIAIIEDENIKNILVNDFKYNYELIENSFVINEESKILDNEQFESEHSETEDTCPIDYNTLSYQELQKLASEKGLKSVGISKDNLIKSLQEVGE